VTRKRGEEACQDCRGERRGGECTNKMYGAVPMVSYVQKDTFRSAVGGGGRNLKFGPPKKFESVQKGISGGGNVQFGKVLYGQTRKRGR